MRLRERDALHGVLYRANFGAGLRKTPPRLETHEQPLDLRGSRVIGEGTYGVARAKGYSGRAVQAQTAGVEMPADVRAGLCETPAPLETDGQRLDLRGSRVIGDGSYGAVFQQAGEAGRGRVLKVQTAAFEELDPDDAADEYTREAHLSMLLGRAGIGPEVHRAYFVPGVVYDDPSPAAGRAFVMEMERFDGDLRQLFETHGTPPGLSGMLTREVGRLIDALYSLHVMCQDIKPRNALYLRKGRRWKIRLSDFDPGFCCTLLPSCGALLPCTPQLDASTATLAALATKVMMCWTTFLDAPGEPIILGESVRQLLDHMAKQGLTFETLFAQLRAGPWLALEHYCADGNIEQAWSTFAQRVHIADGTEEVARLRGALVQALACLPDRKRKSLPSEGARTGRARHSRSPRRASFVV